MLPHQRERHLRLGSGHRRGLYLGGTDLLRAHGVEPEFTTDMSMTTEEMDEEIAVLEARGVFKR